MADASHENRVVGTAILIEIAIAAVILLLAYTARGVPALGGA